MEAAGIEPSDAFFFYRRNHFLGMYLRYTGRYLYLLKRADSYRKYTVPGVATPAPGDNQPHGRLAAMMTWRLAFTGRKRGGGALRSGRGGCWCVGMGVGRRHTLTVSSQSGTTKDVWGPVGGAL